MKKRNLLSVLLLSGVFALAACGGNSSTNSTTNNGQSNSGTIPSTDETTNINDSTTTEEQIVLGNATLNVDSFEGDYHDYVVVGKTYKVIVNIYNAAEEDITASDKIEYRLTVGDGTTNMNGTWATVTETEKAGEFNLKPLSKGLDQHFNFYLSYKLKTDKVWKTKYNSSTIAIYSE